MVGRAVVDETVLTPVTAWRQKQRFLPNNVSYPSNETATEKTLQIPVHCMA
jgi:hypothetical protein